MICDGQSKENPRRNQGILCAILIAPAFTRRAHNRIRVSLKSLSSSLFPLFFLCSSFNNYGLLSDGRQCKFRIGPDARDARLRAVWSSATLGECLHCVRGLGSPVSSHCPDRRPAESVGGHFHNGRLMTLAFLRQFDYPVLPFSTTTVMIGGSVTTQRILWRQGIGERSC